METKIELHSLDGNKQLPPNANVALCLIGVKISD